MPATIHDVAVLAGVSTATVSRALRGLPNVAEATRDKVERAAELLDYVADPAASALAAGRTATLGLVVPSLGRWAHARMLEVIQDRAAAAAFDVLPVALASSASREFFLRRHPFRRRVDGLVVAEVPLDGDDLLGLGEGRPVVAIGLTVDEVDTVVADDASGITEATTHLLALGHRDIAFIGGSAQAQLAAPAAHRSAFTTALAEAGLADDAAHRVVESQASSTGGAAAMSLLLDEPAPPTAVIVASDEMALGAMEVARSRGLALPDDLSIVGVDDQPVAQFVGLTTVRRDVARMSALACDWLLERLDGADQPPRHEVVSTSLLQRGSTSPPPTPPRVC